MDLEDYKIDLKNYEFKPKNLQKTLEKIAKEAEKMLKNHVDLSDFEPISDEDLKEWACDSYLLFEENRGKHQHNINRL